MRKVERVLICVLFFLIGFLSCLIIIYFFQPFLKANLTGFAISGYSGLKSPSDFIDEESIIVLSDKIIIKVNNASLSNYADTGSMNPVFDIGANGIRIKPDSEEQINMGDIVSFEYGDELIVHRVIEKSFDDEGVYFITKGDNADFPDRKIRFEQIKYITVGVIW